MKYTEEQMRGIINEWQQSGLSKKAFCLERNIAYQTFQYWCKRLATARSAGFAEISVADQQWRGTCELIFPSGVRMLFNDRPSVSWLRELIS